MIQDKNGTYYSGYTKDLNRRFDLHSKGDGAKYLIGRAPLKLVYYKTYKYFKNALIAEKTLKRLTRQRKQELINIFEDKMKDAPAAPLLLSRESTDLSAGAPEARF